MRFVIDANMSPRLANLITQAGHDAVAVRDVGLGDADDNAILNYASDNDRIVVSHDTDFGTLFALKKLAKPSFLLIRSSDPLTPDQQADIILANLRTVAADLENGAIVTFTRNRIRIRQLPII